jgi:hypothetical protein
MSMVPQNRERGVLVSEDGWAEVRRCAKRHHRPIYGFPCKPGTLMDQISHPRFGFAWRGHRGSDQRNPKLGTKWYFSDCFWEQAGGFFDLSRGLLSRLDT